MTVCRVAPSLERLVDAPPEDFDRRLRSVRGIGVWTSAEVRQRALGDPDAVSFGDYHLANHVGWALFGHDITDDEMAVALEPYRPQRERAAALACAGGQTRPRRGPRMSVPTHLPTRATGRRTPLTTPRNGVAAHPGARVASMPPLEVRGGAAMDDVDPVLLLATTDPASRDVIGSELRRRYGGDYEVVVCADYAHARAVLEGLRRWGRAVALVIGYYGPARPGGASTS